MPVTIGKVGKQEVEVLRDSGCDGVIVKQKFVNQEWYTGKFCNIWTIDRNIIRAPIAKIYIDTPYI